MAGKYLPPGTSIRTGENGYADAVLGIAVDMPQAKWAPERISLAPDAPVRGMITYKPTAEQNVVRLMPDTLLKIDKLTTTDTGADTKLDWQVTSMRACMHQMMWSARDPMNVGAPRNGKRDSANHISPLAWRGVRVPCRCSHWLCSPGATLGPWPPRQPSARR